MYRMNSMGVGANNAGSPALQIGLSDPVYPVHPCLNSFTAWVDCGAPLEYPAGGRSMQCPYCRRTVLPTSKYSLKKYHDAGHRRCACAAVCGPVTAVNYADFSRTLPMDCRIYLARIPAHMA
jgi:LSD1 subclass zinc finger protein